MNRCFDLHNSTLLVRLSPAPGLLDHIDAFHKNTLCFRDHLKNFTGLSFILAGNHNNLIIFFDT